MICLDYVIHDEQGLHVRPISKIVFALMEYNCRVRAACADVSADGKDIMELMSLNAGKGDKLHFLFDGPQEETAAEALRKLLPEIGL